MKPSYEDAGKEVTITSKGRALLAAIEAGLVEETDEGFDISKFEYFWVLYESGREAEKRTPYFLPLFLSLLSLAMTVLTLCLKL